MSGKSYFWTKENMYCVVVNTISKRFSIDFFPSPIDKIKYSILFNEVKFLRYWFIPTVKAILIALKDSTYLYVKDKVIVFKMEQGDMLVRPVASRDNKFTAIMTRFHTIVFNEDSVMCRVISKDNLRPPEMNSGFVVNEDFDTKYASVYTEFNIMHDAKLNRTLMINNL
jgi:hypothetical protein